MTTPFQIRVVDIATGEPVPNVHVLELNNALEWTGVGTTTDWNGRATVGIGPYELRAVGYHSAVHALVGPQDVELVPRVYDLGEVEIFPDPGQWPGPGTDDGTDNGGGSSDGGNGSNAGKVAGGILLLLLLYAATRQGS
jgi:hypothetical protein